MSNEGLPTELEARMSERSQFTNEVLPTELEARILPIEGLPQEVLRKCGSRGQIMAIINA